MALFLLFLQGLMLVRKALQHISFLTRVCALATFVREMECVTGLTVLNFGDLTCQILLSPWGQLLRIILMPVVQIFINAQSWASQCPQPAGTYRTEGQAVTAVAHTWACTLESSACCLGFFVLGAMLLVTQEIPESLFYQLFSWGEVFASIIQETKVKTNEHLPSPFSPYFNPARTFVLRPSWYSRCMSVGL